MRKWIDAGKLIDCERRLHLDYVRGSLHIEREQTVARRQRFPCGSERSREPSAGDGQGGSVLMHCAVDNPKPRRREVTDKLPESRPSILTAKISRLTHCEAGEDDGAKGGKRRHERSDQFHPVLPRPRCICDHELSDRKTATG